MPCKWGDTYGAILLGSTPENDIFAENAVFLYFPQKTSPNMRENANKYAESGGGERRKYE